MVASQPATGGRLESGKTEQLVPNPKADSSPTATDASPTGGKPSGVATTGAAGAAGIAGLPGTTLGKSVDGRPVVAYVFGNASVGPAHSVLIFGGIHGNEPTSAGVCRELVAYLKSHPDAYRGRCVVVVPEANPDGLARRMRTNTNLVDLNRNFPAANWKKTRKSSYFGGDAAASQPETNLLIGLIAKFDPARICTVHSMDDPCNNYDGPAETLAKAMAKHNGYAVKSNIGYPTPGSFGSWAGTDRKTPVITLELPNRGTTPKSWEKNRDALLAFIKADARELALAADAPADGR